MPVPVTLSPPEPGDEQLAARKVETPAAGAGVLKTPPQSSRFVGTLAVRSDPPGATVIVDGQPVGQTPLELARFRAGSHVVWIESTGYRRWTSGVRVTVYQTTRINATLEVDSEP